MLVSKKQNWENYQEAAATPAVKPSAKPQTGQSKSLRSKCVAAITLFAVMAMLVTLQSASIVKSGYELVQIKAQLAALEKENDYIRLDIAKLKSPQRIQTIATRELGMITPKNIYHASAALTASPTDAGKKPNRTEDVVAMAKADVSAKR